MKVLVLAPHNFYLERGTPIATDLLLRAFSEMGVETHALVYPSGEERSYPGVTIHRCGGPKALREVGPGFSPKKLALDAWFYASARKLVKQLRPDVVHANEESVFMARWMKLWGGRRYVYDMDSSLAQQLVEKHGVLKVCAPVFNAMERWAIRGAEAVAAVCPALTDLAERGGAKRVLTVHDVSQMTPADFEPTGEVRAKLGIGDAPGVVYVGNLEPYQGVELLIESMVEATRVVPQGQLVIAGGKPAGIEKLKALADSLGVGASVHFLGRWPLDKLGSLLGEFEVVASPRVRGVNTPMKVFPYLHSGRALLATDLPTHRQSMGEDVACLAPPEPLAFGAALAKLWSDPALRAGLGQAGRAMIEAEHTYPAHVQRVRALYDGLKPYADV
ncbi:MAG: glycosyltransferase family 4 protein [Planctomycetota bacterium]